MRSPSCERRSRIRTGPGSPQSSLRGRSRTARWRSGWPGPSSAITRTRARLTRLAGDLGEAPQPGMLREHARGRARRSEHRGSVSARLWAAHRCRRPRRRAAGSRPRGRSNRARRATGRTGAPRSGTRERAGARARAGIGGQALGRERARCAPRCWPSSTTLRASRARIVETGDAARRRLERDLHDGAQQRLLALSYDLRLARAGAEPTATRARRGCWTRRRTRSRPRSRSCASSRTASIRRSSPRRGSAPALATLADEAPLPVELGELPAERSPPAVEATAYVVVAEAIEDAARRGATLRRRPRRRDDGRLVVDGRGRRRAAQRAAGPPRRPRRRARRLARASSATTLRAEIPCA